MSESFIFSLPPTMRDIRTAADAFAAQYRGTVRISFRGRVLHDGGAQGIIAEWHRVGALDYELDLLGLGEGEDEDKLLWVKGVKGEVRLESGG